MRLDHLSRLKEKEKALIQARPRLACNIFGCKIGTWPTFQKNQRETYKMFAKDGEEQQIFQLSKILSPELAATVMSFSGAQDGAAKAVLYLKYKFNSPHLLLPKVYNEIRETFPN